jgi:mono/diheme cytochrome c family protein
MARNTDVRIVSTLLGLCLATTALAAPDLGSDAQRSAGKEIYQRHCAQCHGDQGDGNGVAAPHLQPRPRDFTSGKFKIRTTPSGTLPTDEDLKHIIRVGMPYTSMPAWPQFTDVEITALVYYVKSFSAEFAKPDRQVEGMKIPTPPALTSESIERGKQSYAELGCAKCHGELGRTDGSTAPTLKDDAGYSIRSADLTRPWTFRGGATRAAIFRAMTTGLNGTPMPAFGEALTAEQRWNLTDFIHALGGSETPDYSALLIAKKTTEEIDLTKADTLFDQAQPAFFPIIGQIMQPGRDFYPASNGLIARAVYNDSEVAIELRWHDMRGDTAGKNGPELPVPATEDDGDAGAAKLAKADGGGEGWGDAEAEATPAGRDDPWGENDGGDAEASAGATAEFSDAVAIQFPVVLPQTIRKPYFIFGDKDDPVHVWFADLAKKTPSLYLGHGSNNLEALGPRDLTVVSRFEKGEWRVVFTRRMRSAGALSFEERGFAPIAFSAWDGTSRERGNKRGLTTWWSIYFEPAEKPSPVGPMAASALGVLVVEFAFIAWARRRRQNGMAV